MTFISAGNRGADPTSVLNTLAKHTLPDMAKSDIRVALLS